MKKITKKKPSVRKHQVRNDAKGAGAVDPKGIVSDDGDETDAFADADDEPDEDENDALPSKGTSVILRSTCGRIQSPLQRLFWWTRESRRR